MSCTPERILLNRVSQRVIHCRLCPRLTNYITEVGQNKVRRFRHENYWAKPLPSFGDVKAKLLLVGLAPAAHGGNRTGRMFTGDSSGEWVAKVLFKTGFANLATSRSKYDGLILNRAYITAAVRCSPPHNKPTLEEVSNCSQHLCAELRILDKTIKVILTLGKVAFDTYCKVSKLPRLEFAHGGRHNLSSGRTLLASYHPSKQNTNTGRLTWEMWLEIFRTAKSIIVKN
jgi:uracil-DNA glycosylase